MCDEVHDPFARLRSEAPPSATHTFQITDVRVVDELPQAAQAGVELHGAEFVDSIEPERQWRSTCTTLVFGLLPTGASILVRTDDFRPSLMYAGDKYFGEGELLDDIAGWCKLQPSVASRLVVKRRLCKHLYGWQPDRDHFPSGRKEHVYYQVYFPTVRLFRRACRDTPCHEKLVGAECKFLDETNLVVSQWATVRATASSPQRISHSAIEVSCRLTQLRPYVTNPWTDDDDATRCARANSIAPYLVANLDIECVSPSGGFPDARNADDRIVVVGVTYWRYGTPASDSLRVAHVLGRCDDVDGVLIRCYETEADMLAGVRRELVVNVDVDIIATYNGFGFDLPYLWERAEKLSSVEFGYLDRLCYRRSTGRAKELTSSALGNNHIFVIDHGDEQQQPLATSL